MSPEQKSAQTLRVNDAVQTPSGPGIVQGRLMYRDGRIKIMVSHKPAMFGVSNDMWVLREYEPEEVTK